MSFEGKVILITGGNGGIGAACAEYFAEKGALLALVGRNVEKFEKVLENIKENGVETEPLAIIADVTVDAERIISETIEIYGRLDVLINNAGFSLLGSIETIKMEDYDAMMATNLRAVVELTHLAIPHLIESKGNIVNISSVASKITLPFFIGYSMSKAALDQFTKCVAIDLASKGVRVNSINPSYIETDFSASFGIHRGTAEFDKMIEQTKAMHPIERVGCTKDCVNAVAFLAHENASFITGINLPVDGGIILKGAV